MLTLVLAESALETIPERLWTRRSIQRYAKQHQKSPKYVLLDRSYHHAAMRGLQHGEKRGRPDLVHFVLLEALGSPLNKEGRLNVYVHTVDDHVIKLDPTIRLPRNCNRFVNLIEQLFEHGKIPPQPIEKALLKIKRQTLPQLIREIKPSCVLAFSRIGEFCRLGEAVSKISSESRPVVIVGGFPRGHFSETTTKLADYVVSIDREMMETWTITSRIIYEFERAISLPKKRLNKRL